jgi:glutathione S-transferase
VIADLYFLPVSPWSLKARCALRLCEVPVREHVYIPLIGEPALRLRMARFSGRVTVPVLFTHEGVLSDSFDIAQYAERVGHPYGLFPVGELEAIRAWNDASERLLRAGRVCSMLRVLDEPEAALESLPRAAGRIMGARAARTTVLAFNAKYGIRQGSELEATARARVELDTLRAALADGRSYLLGEFSYADVTMALGLQLVQPLSGSPMGPASMRAATHLELAQAYPDVLAWRDRVHAAHGLLPR